MPAPPLAPNARCVAPLRFDGGTAFAAWTEPASWHPNLTAIVSMLTGEDDPVEITKLMSKPPLVQMVLPEIPGGRTPGLAGILETHEAVDVRTRGFGADDAPPVAEVILGSRGRHLTFHFHDRAYVTLGERLDVETGVVRWYIRIEAKHRELYADGLSKWMQRWLGLWSWLLFGKWLDGVRLDERWNTTQCHINSDFVGVEFDAEDESDFLGGRKRSLYGYECEDDADYRDDAWQTLWLQTITCGRKSSDVQLCIYRKGDQLREDKRLQPEKSAYAALWKANGWSPANDGDPVRVEFRLRKKGLQYRREGAGRDDALAYDFRRPSLLLDHTAVQHLWKRLTDTRRLVDRTPECGRCKGEGVTAEGTECRTCDGRGRTVVDKLRAAPTSSRWLVVQSAALLEPQFDIRQVAHAIAQLTRLERQHKAWRSLQFAARAVAMLDTNMHVPHAHENLASLLEVIAMRIRAGDVVRYETSEVVPNELDPGCDSITAKCAFFARELVDEPSTDVALELLRLGGAHGVSRAFEKPPPPVNEEDEQRNNAVPLPRLDNPDATMAARARFMERGGCR